MKKISFLLFAFIAASVIMSSCKKDDNTFNPPTLNFIGGAGYVDQDQTVLVNTDFKVGIAASANAISEKKLSTLRLTRTMDNTTFVDTTFTVNNDQFNADFEFNAQAAGKTEKITFVLTDKDDQSTSLSLNITYEALVVGVTVTKNIDILMGSFNDDNGSFYSTSNKMVYKIADAGTHQSAIDFLFYYGAVNRSTIASPADAQANTVYAMDTWTIKNATLFATTQLSVDDFNAIGSTYEFPAFTSDVSAITLLMADEVIMFKTVGNKLGYIKINQVNGKGDHINIDVIVAE